MITFNQINATRHTCQFARLIADEAYRNAIYNRHREKERQIYVRGCAPETYLNNIMYHEAGQALEPKIAHIPGDNFASGTRYHLIEIPYFAYIPNPNGTPGSRHIWLSISSYEGITLKIEAPTKYLRYIYKRLTGNIPATMENIQAAANKLFLSHYHPDTHPAAVFQHNYHCSKKEALQAWITANKTGYYRAGTYNGQFFCNSAPAPAPDPTKAILRRLRRKHNINAIAIWDESKLLKLLSQPRRKRLTEAAEAPNFWQLSEMYASEHDTDELEEMENFVNSYFEPNTIYI